VDGADAAPAPAAIAGLAALEPIAAGTLDRWEKLSTSGVKALDDALRAAGAEPIKP